jgi:predicted MFS family arabinose efflux permease
MCALLPIAGMGTMHITWTHLVNLWYERNRGLALALMLSGTGLSATFIPSAVTWAVGRWNWQAAFVLLALLPVVLVLPLALRWMETPHSQRSTSQGDAAPIQATSGMAFSDAMRSARFWALNIALAMVVGAMVTMVSNTVPLLRDKGLSAAEASQVFGGFGLSLIGGRVVVGYLIDRLWAPGVAAVVLTMPALGCLLLSTTGTEQTSTLAIATLLVGIGAGAEFDIAAYLMARYFGMRDYGRLFGVHVGLITIAAALAPWLFGLLYTATGAYTAMLAICGTIFLVGPLMLLPLGRYPNFSSLTLAKGLSCH